MISYNNLYTRKKNEYHLVNVDEPIFDEDVYPWTNEKYVYDEEYKFAELKKDRIDYTDFTKKIYLQQVNEIHGILAYQREKARINTGYYAKRNIDTTTLNPHDLFMNMDFAKRIH